MGAIDVGGGVAAIASVGTGNGNGKGLSLPGALSHSYVWSWILFALSVAWLLGMFAMFGGYKGDVAS